MNKRNILASLKNIANYLDEQKLTKEADKLTQIMMRIANEDEISRIFEDIYADEDISNRIKERDLRSYKIILQYEINEEELKTKEFITQITSTELIKRASLEFIIDTNKLTSGDSFVVNIKAINPRSDQQIWEVEYLIEVEDDERISFHASPMINKQNYVMRNINEFAGSDFIRDVFERALKSPQKVEDPVITSIKEKLNTLPGDSREKAFNIALEELQSVSESDYETISRIANEIADTFANSDNKTAEYLSQLIDQYAYEDF